MNKPQVSFFPEFPCCGRPSPSQVLEYVVPVEAFPLSGASGPNMEIAGESSRAVGGSPKVSPLTCAVPFCDLGVGCTYHGRTTPP
ncbi:hypothetical protein TNIN_438821 [Trichonephila inaurata madagascariensis]|uniref:Uncharacterized protein n=1 Tax=Trichonephila inaurata madagascariensis TaxID=2747483 RepID=A0A8X6WUW4_9ARAC|nr:hypothetical protein TNIN_438821 [Trichonephila inaurata madagascariensis]